MVCWYFNDDLIVFISQTSLKSHFHFKMRKKIDNTDEYNRIYDEQYP